MDRAFVALILNENHKKSFEVNIELVLHYFCII